MPPNRNIVTREFKEAENADIPIDYGLVYVSTNETQFLRAFLEITLKKILKNSMIAVMLQRKSSGRRIPVPQEPRNGTRAATVKRQECFTLTVLSLSLL